MFDISAIYWFGLVLPMLVTVMAVRVILTQGNLKLWIQSWAIGLLVLAILSPLYYEFPSSSKSLIVFDGDRIVKRPLGSWEWEHYVNLPTKPIGVNGVTQILVANNRVKKITYSGNLELTSLDLYFSKLERRYPGWDAGSKGERVGYGMQKATSYWFNEMNEQLSKELGQFYNPSAFDQQERFRKLTEEWLNERLAKYEGLKISGMTFAIEY